MLNTCTTCGRPFQRTRGDQPECPSCEPRGRAHADPTTRAQRDGTGDYERHRKLVLAGNPTCSYCPRPAVTADHVIPVAKGGTNDLANLVPACSSCNSSKGARSSPAPAAPSSGASRRGALRLA